jgi:O-antigen ligase
VCLQLAVLCQSRGWLYTAPIVLALMLALIPSRLRLLAHTLLPIASTAAIAPVLLRVYARATPGGVALIQPGLSHVLHTQGQHAVQAMLIADLVLVLLAAVAVTIDRRLQIGRARTRGLNRLAAALAVLTAIAAVAVGLTAVHGDPIGHVERAWHSFADAGVNATATGYSRFGTFASNRADIWRVALHEFAQHPLAGIGQDNFATSYTRLRHTYEQPRWTHSIELRLLTHTGLVGALLFLAFLAAALLAALRGRERGSVSERVSVGILLLALVVWLVHGSIDWLWEYPALSVPALAFAGAAGALGRTRLVVPDRAKHDRAVLRATAWIGAALACTCAIAALAVPFLAARKLERAISVWPSQPALAYGEVRSASDLLSFDTQPGLVGGSLAPGSRRRNGANRRRG